MRISDWSSDVCSSDLIGDAARHPGREVASGVAQHHHHAAGHVFAAVVAHPFHHRRGARVAHREALPRHSSEVALPGDGAVQHGIADDDVVFDEQDEKEMLDPNGVDAVIFECTFFSFPPAPLFSFKIFEEILTAFFLIE